LSSMVLRPSVICSKRAWDLKSDMSARVCVLGEEEKEKKRVERMVE
jgi:hypothetical protein